MLCRIDCKNNTFKPVTIAITFESVKELDAFTVLMNTDRITSYTNSIASYNQPILASDKNSILTDMEYIQSCIHSAIEDVHADGLAIGTIINS
jgi:hypothetical protein